MSFTNSGVYWVAITQPILIISTGLGMFQDISLKVKVKFDTAPGNSPNLGVSHHHLAVIRSNKQPILVLY